MILTTLRQAKPGELFRRSRISAAGIGQDGQPVWTAEPMQAVWVKGQYDRAEGAFWCYKFEDVNNGRYVKSDANVFIDFEY
jgi:hypothetical protein